MHARPWRCYLFIYLRWRLTRLSRVGKKAGPAVKNGWVFKEVGLAIGQPWAQLRFVVCLLTPSLVSGQAERPS